MYFIGSLIKSEREKHRVSQEELCFGICAVSTLSRIENNEQTPTMEKAVALLSRLGLEGSSYMSFISEEEYLFFVIRRDTEAILAHREYMRAYEYVMAQKEYLEKNKFRKQFLLAMDAIKLEEDEYFVLGDNRNNSSDSRDPSVGIIYRTDIIGRAWLRIYPFKDFGFIKHQ